MCLGCTQIKRREDNHCTRFKDKTREELIEMFNKMLEYYNYGKIESNKKI